MRVLSQTSDDTKAFLIVLFSVVFSIVGLGLVSHYTKETVPSEPKEVREVKEVKIVK